MVFRRLLIVAALCVASAASAQQKVIVLGFDGVDARYTERWMNEGKLPNLARLRAQGTFRPLLPTTPAQTPVSWSTFSTGIDPGRTGIFDFLRRDPKTYLPFFAAFANRTIYCDVALWLGSFSYLGAIVWSRYLERELL